MKIAILLPENPDLGWRWRAQQLAAALMAETDPGGGPIEVAVGLPRMVEPEWRRQEAEIRDGAPGVVVRHLGWERVATDLAQRMYPACKGDLERIGDVALPRDWGWNFVDCDAWIVCANAGMGAVMPLKPTAYYVRDLAARYVPEAFADGINSVYWVRQTMAFRLWRQSPCVFTTDTATANDIASYAGVRRDRIVQVPQLRPAAIVAPARGPATESSMLWLAEPDARHNLSAALEGLRLYQAEGGAMKTIVAGEAAHGFDPAEGQPTLAAVPTRSRRSTLNMAFETVSGERDLSRVLGRIDLVWSSALADGENDGLLRAAQAGVPFVGLRYPQSERLAEVLGVRATFYDTPDAGSIADALKTASVSTPMRAVAKAKPVPRAWASVVERLWGGVGG